MVNTRSSAEQSHDAAGPSNIPGRDGSGETAAQAQANLDAQIARARRQVDDEEAIAAKRLELQELVLRRDTLRRDNDDESATPQRPPQVVEPIQDVDDEEEPPPHRHENAFNARGMRPEAPPDYWGDNRREHREFTQRCRDNFAILSADFTNEYSRIVYAAQYLRGSIYTAWTNHRKHFPAETMTWEEFSTFLLNRIEGKVIRDTNAVQRYDSARQRSNQSIASFDAYLEMLEDDLPEYTEQQKRDHLLAKMSAELRRHVLLHGAIPATRLELLERAMLVENIAGLHPDKKTKRQRDQPSSSSSQKKPRWTDEPTTKRGDDRAPNQRDTETSKPKGHSDRQKQGSGRGRGRGGYKDSSGDRRPATRGDANKTGACFECGAADHWRPDCPRLKKADGPATGPNRAPVSKN